MNSRDRANLEFIMGSSPKDFDDWMNVASSDDIDYAMELIRQHRLELITTQIELQDLLAVHEDEMTDAKAVIERIKNVGKL